MQINDRPLCWPLDQDYKVTSPFGERNFGDGPEWHWGIDVGGMAGRSPIYAAESGTVEYAGPDPTGVGGNIVVIDHGNGFKTRYLHCQELFAKTGDYVGYGQQIASVGSTGQSQGVHLHFEIHKDGGVIDPQNFKFSNGWGNGKGGFGSSMDGIPIIRDTPWLSRRL